MNLSTKKGFIYIKNNGLRDEIIKTRALGEYYYKIMCRNMFKFCKCFLKALTKKN